MKDYVWTYEDKSGASHCNEDGTLLQYEGEWSYNLEVVPGCFSFRCPKCGHAYVGTTEERDRHLKAISGVK